MVAVVRGQEHLHCVSTREGVHRVGTRDEEGWVQNPR